MEQTVGERPSSEQCISQLHMQHSDTMNSNGVHFERNPSFRSWTGQDKAQIPLCRDNLRGRCARGAFCKYHHAEPVEHGGSRFHQSERGGLDTVSKLGNSQLHRENKDNDSRTRFASGGYRRRSPCRRFQSGSCHRGSSCPYLHPELVRCDRATYNVNIGQQQVQGSVGVPGFGEGNRDNASGLSQGGEEADKENCKRTMNLSREHRSRSPCRNFLRGKCNFGSNCKRFHPVNDFVRSRTDLSYQHHRRLPHIAHNPGYGEAHPDVLRTSQGYGISDTHNSSRSGAFLKKPDRRSPSQNISIGHCYNGNSFSDLHPAPVYDRRRYDSYRTQRRDEVPATTRTAHFTNGSLTSSRMFQNHENLNNHGSRPRWDMQGAYQENQARSTTNVENMDSTSRSCSSEKYRNNNSIDLDRNKLVREPEVCLRFTKGKCTNGEFCKYLHGYHKYASSNWNIKSTEAAVDSRTHGVENQVDTVMDQQHDGVKTATKLSTVDQQGDALVMDGQKCEIFEEKPTGLCNPAEGHEEVSLWSRPFKRRRSRSRSPLPPRNDSQMDLHRNRYYNVAQFHYPGRRSNAFQRPMFRVNSNRSSNSAGTSINPCYRGEYDSKSVGQQRHDEAVNVGPNPAQRSSLGSHIASVGKNNDTEFASISVQDNHVDQQLAIDSMAVDMPLGDVQSVSASLCEEHLVLPEANCSSLLKEGSVELSDVIKVDVMPSMQSFSSQGFASCEETMKDANTSKQQENGSSIDIIEKKLEPSPATVEVSRRKLLVLDVNGLLADIVAVYPPHYKPDTIVSAKGVFKRPFCDEFLQFCFERYDVGIWSSRNKKNVTSVVDFLMKDTKNRLLFCWDQSHCTPTGYNTVENREKPLVLKELKYLWDKEEESLPWKKGYYNESNTILLDDSPYKALRNPPYTAIFPYPYKFKDVQDKSLGPGGDLRLYLERLAEAENAQKFIQENPFGQRPITKTNLSWAFYAKIIASLGTSDGSLLQEKSKEVGISDRIQIEEKANIVGSSNGGQLEEKAETGGTSNGSRLEKGSDVIGTHSVSQLEEAATCGSSGGSQGKEEAEVVCISTANESRLETTAKFLGTDDGRQLEEEAVIDHTSDASQQEEETGIVGIGTSNGSQPEKEAEIVGSCDRSQTEEGKIGGDSDGSQLEEKPQIYGTPAKSQLEQKDITAGSFYGSQQEENVNSTTTDL